MQVFFSVGEPSGDLHGANLIRSLQKRNQDWKFVGYGGPRMAEAGCQLHTDLTQLAVMWITQVLVHIRTFLKLVSRADQYFETNRPDLVVLIDYPGFNWWIARKAKARGIPVVYYGTPQLWAWASWRVSKMRRFVDHVLCKLPFEEPWFRQRGCRATFVGHPYFDELKTRSIDEDFVSQQANDRLVVLLPGSRDQEIKWNLPPFLQAAKLIKKQVPDVKFAIAIYKQSQRRHVQNIVQQSGLEVEMHVNRTAELIQSAHCCLACSGSVSLELLYHSKPSAILYQISKAGYLMQWIFRKVRYITLVNLLTAENPFADGSAGNYDSQDPQDKHVLMPEYLTCIDRSPALAGHVVAWLTDEAQHERIVKDLTILKEQVAQGGASELAAEYITQLMQASVNPAQAA
ncbi:MAG TPA: lipid-A-disaccharide synthase [Planctomycetaceae bacterium]|nr:lipid-A-disaccharide synthase [Planctomycetaceae bacterium]